MEEFGVSSDFASDEHAATYYRHVLYNTLLAGATGWIAWNNTDFDARRSRTRTATTPSSRTSGSPTPTARRRRRSGRCGLRARRSRRSTSPGAGRADTDTALIVSQLPGHPVPVHLAGNASGRRQVAAPGLRRGPAGRPAAEAHQGDDGHRGRRAAVPRPVGQAVPGPHRRRPVEELAAETAPPSTSRTRAGDVAWHRGPSYGRMNELFGITAPARRRARRPDRRRRRRLTFTRDFGGLPGAPRSTSRPPAASTAAPTCRSPRPPPRSSPPTPTAAPRCCGARPAGAR